MRTMKHYLLPDFYYGIYYKAKIEKKCRIRKVYIWILSTLCLKDVFTVPLRRMKIFFSGKGQQVGRC